MGSVRGELEPLYRPAVIQRILSSYGLRPHKGLGQNFLADGNTVARIVTDARLSPGDKVLEIGPGLGSLTQGLLRCGARVVAIEKDAGMVRALRDVLGACPDLEIVHGDALTTGLDELFSRFAESDASLDDAGASCKVVANLPYYITSPLLMHILESDFPLERVVVMVQQEVAGRLTADPGTKSYGALTVGVRYLAEVETGGRVPATVFFPPPTVASEIVILTPRPSPWDVGSERLFFAVVKAAFGRRRKTLNNALKVLKIPNGTVRAALLRTGISGQRRGETLSLEEFAKLARALAGE